MKCNINKNYFIVLLIQIFNYTAFGQKLVSQSFIGHTTEHEINIWCMFKNTDTVFIKNSDNQTKFFIYKKENCFRKFLPINCKFNNLTENQTYTVQYSFNNKFLDLKKKKFKTMLLLNELNMEKFVNFNLKKK